MAAYFIDQHAAWIQNNYARLQASGPHPSDWNQAVLQHIVEMSYSRNSEDPDHYPPVIYNGAVPQNSADYLVCTAPANFPKRDGQCLLPSK